MKTCNPLPSRRAFVQGLWGPANATPRSVEGCIEIVSLIVKAWPEHLAAVEAAIVALGNAEVHARDAAKGSLIVVLEAATQGEIGAKANAVSGLPHVLSSVMVFQGSDGGQEVT